TTEDASASFVTGITGGTKGSLEFSFRGEPGSDLVITVGSGIPGVNAVTSALMLVLSKGTAGIDAYWTNATATDTKATACTSAKNHTIKIIWDIPSGVWGALIDDTPVILHAGFAQTITAIQYFSIITSSDVSKLFGGSWIIDDIVAGTNSSVVVPGGVAPPSNITATAATGGITLLWTDNSTNETGFRIYRGDSTPLTVPPWTKPSGDLPAGTKTWTDTSAKAGETWYYLVCSYIENGNDDINGIPENYVSATMPASQTGTSPADGVYVAGSCKPAGSTYNRAVIWHDDGTTVTPIYLTAGTASSAGVRDIFIASDAIWACGFENKVGSDKYNALRWKIDPDFTVTQTTLGSGDLNMIAKGITVVGDTVYTVGDDYNVEGIAAVLWTDTTKSFLTSSTAAYYAAGNAILADAGNIWMAGTYDSPSRNNAHYWVRGSVSNTVNVNTNYTNTSYGQDIATGTGGVYVGGGVFNDPQYKATYWLDNGTSFVRYVIGPDFVNSYMNGLTVEGTTVHAAGYAQVEGDIYDAMYWHGKGTTMTSVELTHPGNSAYAKDIARSNGVSYISGYWTDNSDNVAAYWTTNGTLFGRKALTSTETVVSVERIATKNPVASYTNKDIGDGTGTGGPGTGVPPADTRAQYPTGVTASGLIGWWPFNGSSTDTSEATLGGSSYGSPTYTTDRFGKVSSCISLDGTDDYVSIPDTTVLDMNTSSISFSMWISIDSLALDQAPWLLYKSKKKNNGTFDNGYALGYSKISGQNALTFSRYNGSYPIDRTIGIASLSATTWTHLCATYDYSANVLLFYKNGVLQNEEPVSLDYISENNYPLFIGRGNYESGSQDYFKGKIDDLRLFNRLLSSTEVLAMYHEEGYGQ
ncbi:MAG TPA: LamG domain-containing protein, partial [Treponemataceae bacterium]|nr:LamG domain-containing protein [Treponemataceae bacterium]